MASVEEVRDRISKALDDEEKVRDLAYDMSRSLIRSCRICISDLIEGGSPDDGGVIENAEKLRELISGNRLHRFPFVEDAFVEYVEMVLLRRALDGIELPLPEEIEVSERSYVLGACDTIGELRRVVLNNLLSGEVDEALKIFATMKEMARLTEGLSYPSGMIQLKKKQDTVRSLLDRTAGELAVSIRSRSRKTPGGGGEDD
jgi:translin